MKLGVWNIARFAAGLAPRCKPVYAEATAGKQPAPAPVRHSPKGDGGSGAANQVVVKEEVISALSAISPCKKGALWAALR